MCSNGSFGEKWQKLAKQYAPNVTSFIFACGWAVPYNPDAIVAAAKKENCDTVMFVHHETSCGFVNKMKAIGRACAAADLLCFADCVSSFGVEEIVLGDGTDGITGITFSSNKGTMCYPGVSVVVARKDYCQKVDPMAVPMYLNLNGYYKFAETKKQTPFTPAAQLLQCLDASLEYIDTLGIDAIRAACRARFTLLVSELEKRGFSHTLGWDGGACPGSEAHCSNGVGTFYLPSGVNGHDLQVYLESNGFAVYEYVKGYFQGRALQISTYGNLSEDDVHALIAQIDAFAAERKMELKAPPKVPLVLLVAGMGTRLRKSTGIVVPKCMVELDGESIMKRMITNAARSGVVSDVTIVVGYEKEQVTQHAKGICDALKIDLHVVESPDFATTNTSKSVLVALRTRTSLNDGFILSDGDLVCHRSIFNRVAHFPESCAAVARPSFESYTCDDQEAVRVKIDDKYLVTAMGKKIGTGMGESIGLYKLHKDAIIIGNMDKHLDEAEAQEYYEDGWAHAIDAGEKFEMTSVDVTGFPCVEVDDADDYEMAQAISSEIFLEEEQYAEGRKPSNSFDNWPPVEEVVEESTKTHSDMKKSPGRGVLQI